MGSMGKDGKRRLENAILVIGKDRDEAMVTVLDTEVDGLDFESFGIDDEGAFLEDAEGLRHHLNDEATFLAPLALEKGKLFVYEISIERSEYFKQYEVSACPEAPTAGMGSP